MKAVISLVGVVDFSFRVDRSEEEIERVGRRASLVRMGRGVKRMGTLGRGSKKGKDKAQ